MKQITRCTFNCGRSEYDIELKSQSDDFGAEMDRWCQDLDVGETSAEIWLT